MNALLCYGAFIVACLQWNIVESTTFNTAISRAVESVEEEINCKYDGPYSEDPCQRIRQLYENNEKDIFLDTLVLVATKNGANSYTVRGFGVAVAENYFLSVVSSDFRKYGSENLYIIYKQKVYTLKSEKVYPNMFIGPFNLRVWNDLFLVNLSPASNLKFTKFMKINGNTGISTDKNSSMIKMGYNNDQTQLVDARLFKPGMCKEMFGKDVVQFNPFYMGCSNENNEGDKDFLRGSPITQLYYGHAYKPLLVGVHSLDSLTHPGYLITYVAPHCAWLASVSNGAVKCAK